MTETVLSTQTLRAHPTRRSDGIIVIKCVG